jgi:tRNA(Arg) A34 adenosine deaminase TadA
MHFTSATIELPAWLMTELAQPQRALENNDTARMQRAIELAQRNVNEGTGGPFAALVIDESTGQCVGAGVNLVVALGLSLAHAEAVAITLAQRNVGTYDLASRAGQSYSLYATGQPCIMCFGILWWSGITKLVCGARAEDIETIAGFREGPLPNDWVKMLAERRQSPAIEVMQDVLRDQACDVLRAYAAAEHPIYNPGDTMGD